MWCVRVYVYGVCLRSVFVARGRVRWVRVLWAGDTAGAKVPRCETGCLSGARSMSSSVGRKEAIGIRRSQAWVARDTPEAHSAFCPGARTRAADPTPMLSLAVSPGALDTLTLASVLPEH